MATGTGNEAICFHKYENRTSKLLKATSHMRCNQSCVCHPKQEVRYVYCSTPNVSFWWAVFVEPWWIFIKWYLKPGTSTAMGTAVVQWLRCCATNRKVAGSIPDGVNGILHWHNPSDRTMVLGLDSASNRNENQEHFLGVKAAGAYGWQTYHHPVPLSCNLGTLNSWNPLGHSKPVMGLLYLY